ncbi:MAG: hypothetical protein ACO3KY_13080 [Lysobacterales bacterium]
MRIVAQSGDMTDTGNVFGVMRNARDGQDSRDLRESAPFGSRYLTGLFQNTAFEETSWGYTSDVRSAARAGSAWDFEVRSGQVPGPISLSMQGDLPSGIAGVRLENVETGETFMFSTGAEYSFAPVGAVHRFRLVLE